MSTDTKTRALPLGVSADGRRYRARIRVHRQEHNLGNFATVEAAVAARRAAEKTKLRDRFLAKVGPLDPVTTCREWQGTMSCTGYGLISVQGRYRGAHRVAYELFKGPVPDGLDVHHICRNPRCVSWDHLQAVTRSQNAVFGIGPQVTRARNYSTHGSTPDTCKRGHPMSGENLYVSPDGKQRACRECGRARCRGWMRRWRAQRRMRAKK
jgi:hypothetical protein